MEQYCGITFAFNQFKQFEIMRDFIQSKELACFAFIYLRMNAFVFGLIMIAFCVIYIIIASILVYRYASKTFRLRQ